MSMHPDVKDAIDRIDAAVFSDTFLDSTNRYELRRMIARWHSELDLLEGLDESKGEDT